MNENPAMQRGYLLYEAEHFEQAGEMFVEVLRNDPQNARAQAMLALCLARLKQWKRAIEAAREAVVLDPEEALAHEALAVIYLNANRLEEADKAIRRALELEPESATYWNLAGILASRRSQWQQALDAAERGLRSEPGDGPLLNLRSMALMKLGRAEAAREGLLEILAENPENPDSLSNLGWAMLHQGRPNEALDYFKAALQLDPENEYAREGLLDGLRGRYPFYGLILRFFLWMSGMSQEAQQAIQVGLYLGETVLVNLARNHKWLRPFVRPLILAYTVFAYMTWLAKPLANLLLRFNRYGRLVLTSDDIAQSNLVGSCLAVTAIFLGLNVLTGDHLAFLGWATFLTLCIPVSAVHECHEGWPRKVMSRVALGMAILAILGLLLVYFGVEQGWYFVGIYFRLIAPVQFLAMYLNHARPELGHE